MVFLTFGLVSFVLGSAISAVRHHDIPTDWATLVEAVQLPNGYSMHLTLFHPETGYQRELVTLNSNAVPETLRWSPDGQWLLIAVQPQSNGPTLYRVQWTGRHFAPISQIQRSFALQATEWSPDGQWGSLLEAGQDSGDILLLSADGSRVTTLVGDLPLFVVPPYIRWSPDGTWAWVAYSISDQETAVYRIDGKTFEVVALPSLNGTLDAMEVSSDGEWITYSIRRTFGDPLVSIARSRPDGSDIQILARVQLKIIPRLWWTEQGDLMVVVEDLAGTNYAIGRLDASEGNIAPVIEDLPIASRLRWSHDGRYMATHVVTDGDSYVLVVSADGRQQWQYPVEEICMFIDPRWTIDDEWLIFLRRRDPFSGVCEYHWARRGDDEVTPIFQSESEGYELDTSAADHRDWLPVAHLNDAGFSYVTELLSRKTGDIVALPNGRVMAWSKIPLRTEDSRVVIVVGMLCLGGTIIVAWNLRR